MDKLPYFMRYFVAGSPYDAHWQALQQKAQQNGFRTPSLSLTFEGAPSLALDSQTSYPITITITRDADDPLTQPCIIHWDPIEDGFGQQGIKLLRSNYSFTEDLEPVQVDSTQLPAKPVHPKIVSAADPCFKELYPGCSVSWELILPSVYFDSFQEGQYYKFLWVGGSIFLWDWGTLAEYSGRTLRPNHYAVVIPGGPQHLLGIAYVESDLEEPGSLPPSPAPLLVSAPISDAPVFSLTVAGPATPSMRDRNPDGRLRYSVSVTVSYDAAPEGFDGKPVTFHTYIFKDSDDSSQEGFRLYFKKKDEDDWSSHTFWYGCSYYMSQSESWVNVGRDEDNEFAALMPGESWSCTREVTDFPKDVAPGDVFRYRFKGAHLDWWDWGHFRDHENTVVFISGNVRNPQDNGGRPGLLVPASNSVEFTMVD
jgi:hypothetical protein